MRFRTALALIATLLLVALAAVPALVRDTRPPPPSGVLLDPESIALDPSGQLIVADEDSRTLLVLSLSPELGRVVGRYQRMPDRPDDVVTTGGGVAVLGSGHLVFVDQRNQLVEVRLTSPTELEVVRRFGDGLDGTEDIVLGPDGLLYVAEEDRSRIVIFSSEGVRLRHWDLPERPESVAIVGDVAYVCYAHDDWIGRHALATGELLGRLVDDAGWHVPESVTLGPDGNLYVVDQRNHRIVVVRPPTPGAPEGTVVRELGGLGSAPGELFKPEEIVFDAAGRLVVADGGNGRVQVLDLEGRPLAVID